MFKKKSKLLEKKIDMLIKLLEESNIRDLLYILGNKKDIIKRNILARYFKGSRNWHTE